jgi:hypothetical protein
MLLESMIKFLSLGKYRVIRFCPVVHIALLYNGGNHSRNHMIYAVYNSKAHRTWIEGLTGRICRPLRGCG